MQVWMLILIIFGILLIVAITFDFITKKKKRYFDPEQGIKSTSQSEQIYKEQHLKQTITDINDPNL
jgi:uncharacterized membrane protein